MCSCEKTFKFRYKVYNIHRSATPHKSQWNNQSFILFKFSEKIIKFYIFFERNIVFIISISKILPKETCTDITKTKAIFPKTKTFVKPNEINENINSKFEAMEI